ncbi:putative bifunctional diguanylate cyclase/phosphodiesterase [Sphingomonas hankookensis]|uniref:putative bifunctional diguanylate cyclase/phosphodiesterase n=1 Tax=Sphingomonas hankookensis TaxID=563996 RepID=UPI00234E8FD2|nr:GGDEF domain-containing phosphodiesterase [Sphingomonas hankookensis]WCP71370.1 GGDEF domain-containing phosphodiesterase [Sphingomonas hankookensis]
MTAWTGHDAAQQRALFVLSSRQRDELAAILSRAGWRVVAARRSDGLRQRVAASGTAIAIVDARGAIDEGIAATAELARIAGHGDALLVLVSRGDVDRLGALHDAGATHLLVSPIGSEVLLQAVRSAERHVVRMGGGWHDPTAGAGAPLGWRHDAERGSLQLTPALAEATGFAESSDPRALLRALGPDGRRIALAAIRRLTDNLPATAFAHDLPGLGRVVQHVARDAHSGRLHALIEPLARVGDIGAVVREALGSVRDHAGAQRWLDRRIEGGERPGIRVLAIAGIDPINRQQGRVVGDTLLRAVERRIEQAVRDAGVARAALARLGGTEFGVLLPHGNDEGLEEALRQALARPFVAGSGMVTLGLRQACGVAAPGESGDQLIRRVEGELPGARADDAQGPLAADGADVLAGEVHRAIDRGEIAIRFQPQVDLLAGRIVGVEALARWDHPERGELGAELLFAAATHARLAGVLSAHVQHLAMRIAAGWDAPLSRLRLSINVTAEDVAQPDFAETLLAAADDSGFPRDRLTVEITESGLIAELGEAAGLLATLRAAGCRVAIDDFGTGYSSLAYLKALPLDYLKLDRRLTQDIVGSHRDRVVVRGVIDMARSLDLTVIAEGVETVDQRDALATEGCQLYQGFLCAEPLTVPALTALLG